MRIQWVGQCCFHIRAADGRCLLLDPFQRVIGLPRGEFPADVVVFSHAHIDHSDPSAVPNGAKLVTSSGFTEVAGFRLLGVPAYHDPRGGLLSGSVNLFSVSVDGFRILHLSDLGEDLSDDKLRMLGRPDVLLFPAGEHTTISLSEARRLVERIRPAIAVPMAFHQPGLLMPAASQTAVEKMFPIHRKAGVLELVPGTRLGNTTEVRILDCRPWPEVGMEVGVGTSTGVAGMDG